MLRRPSGRCWRWPGRRSAAVATISIARFWAAGLAGNGGSALEGLAQNGGRGAVSCRCGRGCFTPRSALANEASTGLLGSGSVTKDSANLLALGVGAGVGLGFSAWGCS